MNSDQTIEILEEIPFTVQTSDLFPLLRIKPGSGFSKKLERFLPKALRVARPKVVYKLSEVSVADQGAILVDGKALEGHLIKDNLSRNHRAFPFIATCGTELAQWSLEIEDSLEQFWADTICLTALGVAIEAFKAHLGQRFKAGKTSTMTPGSLEGWPLDEQKKVFSLLGGSSERIGVTLNENNLMTPLKSLSGIEFESETEFHSCQLCPRERCIGRRVPYEGGQQAKMVKE